MKIHLLEPEGFPASALEKLRGVGKVVIGSEPCGTEDVEAVFTRLGSFIGADFHRRYPALRWIVSPTTGLNHIDTQYFAEQGIEVISLRGRTTFLDTIRATAEHTLALGLALLRRIPAATADVKAGNWNRYSFKGHELHGKNVLIYGYGRIGRQVARLYDAFGCRVYAHDAEAARVPGELRCSLAEVLPVTDILSVHLPLVPTTKGLIGRQLLWQLPARCVLINTSRGEVLDQGALLDALEERVIAGAALDVLTDEPAPLRPDLLERIVALQDRLIVTPHIGGFTFESLEKVEEYITDLFIQAANDFY